MKKGLVHIYYGDGKGKTSSAIGLSVRAAGAGLKVFITRFLKDSDSSELCVLKKIDGITLGDTPISLPFYFTMTPKQKLEYKAYAHSLLRRAEEEMQRCDVVIMDEFLDAVSLDIISLDEAVKFIKLRPEQTELVMTGHTLIDELAELAHYISHITAEKHPFTDGVAARKGIEF